MSNAPVIKFEGQDWKVLGTGVVRDDGKTFCHLASTTEFVQQRNGARPIQIGVWVDLTSAVEVAA